MRLPRFRILTCHLMMLVLCVGMGLAALRSSSFLCLRTLNTLVTASLFVAILAAWHGAARRKAFWFGFALLGWGYYFLAFGPWDVWHTTDPGSDSYEEIKPNLLTTDIVLFAVKQVTAIPPAAPGPFLNLQSPEYIERTICSRWIGHLLLTLMIAYGGGWLSVLLGNHPANRATIESTKDR